MDDLGQLIFIVLFILFGLISSSKKKARRKPRVGGATSPAGAAPSRTRVQEPPVAEEESPFPSETPVNADEKARSERALAEELLVFLQGQAEPESAPVVLRPEVDEEAQSVETLEPAGGESHERLREKYVDASPQQRPYAVEETLVARPYAITDTPVERPYLVEETEIPQPYSIHDSPKRTRRLTRDELRHAFVMKEVLGPPKALE